MNIMNFYKIVFTKAPNIDDFLINLDKILRALRKSEKIADRALDIATLIHFCKNWW